MSEEVKTENLPVHSELGATLAEAQNHRDAIALADSERMGRPRGSTEGIGTLELSKDEMRILLAPVDQEHEVDIRPDGLLYVPHTFVRRRFTLAFRGAWGVRQEREPGFDRDCNAVIFDGSLWVRGRFIRRAMGECRWYPGNKRLSKASAIEGAESDCISRCAKGLSLFYELWDPQFVAAWKSKYAETYEVVNRRGERDTRWKRKGGTVDPDREIVESQAEEPPAGEEPGQAAEDASAPRCPACGRPMKRRQAKNGGEFYGCTGYPQCRKTMPIPKENGQAAQHPAQAATPPAAETPAPALVSEMMGLFKTLGITPGMQAAYGFEVLKHKPDSKNGADVQAIVVALRARLVMQDMREAVAERLAMVQVDDGDALLREAFGDHLPTEQFSAWTPEQVRQFHGKHCANPLEEAAKRG